MMRYPLLTRVTDDRQIYLQDHRLLVRSLEGVERRELAPDELPGRIGAEFGVDPEIAAKALAILKRKGESHGRAPTP